jgi:HAMP domain-containing protein
MEAISRGTLSPERAKFERDEALRLSHTFAGFGMAAGKEDKKIADTLDKELTKNYINQSKLFRDLTDITKRDAAKVKINEKIESGSIKMSDLDPGSLKTMAREFAEALGTSRFIKQFNDMNASQQGAIKGSMIDIVSGAGSEKEFGVRKALLKMGDATNAFKSMDPTVNADEIKKIATSLDKTDFRKFMESAKNEEIKALKEAINYNIDNLHRSVKEALGSARRGDWNNWKIDITTP